MNLATVFNEEETKASRRCVALSLSVGRLSCIVRIIAFAEIIINAAAALLSTTGFFYNLVRCSVGGSGSNNLPLASVVKSNTESDSDLCGLITNITTSLEFELSSHIGAFILVSCIVHIIIGVILYEAASERNIKKCQLAFILATGQWMIGIIVFISVVESNQLAILIFLVFFTVKFLYLLLIRTYKHALLKDARAEAPSVT